MWKSPICISSLDSIFVCYLILIVSKPLELVDTVESEAFDVPCGNGTVVQEEAEFGIVCLGRWLGYSLGRLVNDHCNDKLSSALGLVPGAVCQSRSLHSSAPLEIQELSEQLQELQNEELELLRKEKLYAKLSVKDKILATSSETTRVENVLAEMLRDLDQQMEKRADDGKETRVKPRRVRAMAMTIRYGVRGMILAAQSEAFKKENGMMRTVVMDEAHASRSDQVAHFLAIQEISRYEGWHDAIEGVRDEIRFEYWVASSSGRTKWTCAPFEALHGRKCRSLVLWAEIGESSLTGPELVLDMTDKVVLIKEKLKSARDRQKSYVDKRRKPLEGLRYVRPFEILERIGPVAYRLRLPEELSGVHDTFHVSNLKKCLAGASLHVPLNEIKVRWNSKRGPEFTWEREDYMKSNYTQLFVNRADESAN
ncbi:hypothetical protein Tco_1502857 [Tanacetum coccineum]